MDKKQLLAFRQFKINREQIDEESEDDSDCSTDEGDGSNEDSEPNGSNEERASGASSDED